MKKKILQHKRIFLIVFLAIFCAVGCIKLDSLIHPAMVNAGETFNVTMKTRLDPASGYTKSNVKYIIGFLAPKSWNAKENTTVVYTSVKGNGSMVLVSDALAVDGDRNWTQALRFKYGVGPNLLDDMEWVVFQSDKAYDISDNDKIAVDVKLTIKAGPENMKVKLGYFVGNNQDILSAGLFTNNPPFAVLYSDCFDVVNGSGDLVDFCNPPMTSVSPNSAFDNDVIDIIFDKKVLTQVTAPDPPALGDDIYLCVKGYTASGVMFENCTQTPESKLQKVAGTEDKYDVYIWPKSFLKVPENETLSRLEYYFTNANGSVKVGYNNTQEPFKFNFKCN